MAGHISTAEQEPVQKKCRIFFKIFFSFLFKENFGIFEIMFFVF